MSDLPQTSARKAPVIMPPAGVIARMRQAKQLTVPPLPAREKNAPIITAPAVAVAAPAQIQRKEAPAVAVPPQRKETRVVTAPPGLLRKIYEKKINVPLVTTSPDEGGWDGMDVMFNDDEQSLIDAGVLKPKPTYVPELDGIVPQKGGLADHTPPKLLCGQNVGMFGDRANQWPDVPPSSGYDRWIWEALRPSYNQVSVELYVSAGPLWGEPRVSKKINKQGKEIETTHRPRNKPIFSYDHHALINVDNKANTPWRWASRVMLIPVTYREELHKGNQYNRAQTRYVSDINLARSMLDQESGGLHVIHGKCSLSFADDDGSEHLSEYWVVLPLSELKRIDAQYFSTESDWISYAQDASTKPSTYLRPNERDLGVWRGEGAKMAYKAAKSKTGAVMPKDWTPEEVSRLNLLHHGKVKREKSRSLNEEAIIQPLSVQAKRVSALMAKGASSSVEITAPVFDAQRVQVKPVTPASVAKPVAPASVAKPVTPASVEKPAANKPKGLVAPPSSVFKHLNQKREQVKTKQEQDSLPEEGLLFNQRLPDDYTPSTDAEALFYQFFSPKDKHDVVDDMPFLFANRAMPSPKG